MKIKDITSAIIIGAAGVVGIELGKVVWYKSKKIYVNIKHKIIQKKAKRKVSKVKKVSN